MFGSRSSRYGAAVFTQKQIAHSLGITTQAATMALRGCRPAFQPVSQREGARTVTRTIRVYSPSDVFGLAVRTGKLDRYREMCEQAGLPAEAYHVTRKEQAFGELLRRFLPVCIEILSQHRVGAYRVDFYLPAFRLGIEFDERHHQSERQAERDAARQEAIRISAGMRFIRVAEGLEEAGLFMVAEAVLVGSH